MCYKLFVSVRANCQERKLYWIYLLWDQLSKFSNFWQVKWDIFNCILVVGRFWNENRKMESSRDVANLKGSRNHYDIFCQTYWGTQYTNSCPLPEISSAIGPPFWYARTGLTSQPVSKTAICYGLFLDCNLI